MVKEKPKRKVKVKYSAFVINGEDKEKLSASAYVNNRFMVIEVGSMLSSGVLVTAFDKHKISLQVGEKLINIARDEELEIEVE